MTRRTYSDDEIRAALEASHGNLAATARALGANERSLRRRLKAMQGDLEAPDGFKVTGKSTLIDRRTGETVLEWVKISRDAERQRELIAEAIEAMSEDVPRIKPTPGPRQTLDHLLAVYPMGDPHIGMLSWGEETGADFDLGIAERDLCAAMAYLVEQAPPAKRALIANLGDFFHADNMAGVTSRSGHVLDMDSRLPKM